MNNRLIARGLGGFVLLLGLAGLAMGEQQLADSMNIDMVLDITRIALGALLVYASFKSAELLRTAFIIFGVVYLGNFAIALISPTMFGLLPHEYGLIDNILHAGGGLLALGLAFMKQPGKTT